MCVKWELPEKTAIIDDASTDGGAVSDLRDGEIVTGQTIGFRHVVSALTHAVNRVQ